MPSKEQMKRDHLWYGHLGQAATIADELRRAFPALEIIGPEEAESKRYVAVYVTLVPGRVRMRILRALESVAGHGLEVLMVSHGPPTAAIRSVEAEWTARRGTA